VDNAFSCATSPVIEWEINTVNKRPELQLLIYRANKSNLKTQFQVILKSINAFAQQVMETD
jgi:hypothetical protein